MSALRTRLRRASAWQAAKRLQLSHKRNSKDFDRLNWPAAISLHDQILHIENSSWAHNRVWTQRDSIGADDDKRRRCNVSVSDLLEMVRRLRQSRSFRAIQL